MRIFLNTRGTNGDEVPKELVEFLYYMENTTDRAAAETESERIRRIQERVNRAKKSEAVGMRFMREIEERNAAREEGRTEGIAQGRSESILEVLENVGDVPENVKERIRSQKDEEVLIKWLLLAAKAESMEDFVKAM